MLKPLAVAMAMTMALASHTVAAANNVRYQVTDLGVGNAFNGSQWFGYWGEHINNSGNVLANLETQLSPGSSQYYARPAFWNGTAWLQMPEISGRTGSTWTYSGNGMNDSGLVVGASSLTASEFDDSIVGQYQGFVWDTNTNQVTTFGAPTYGSESSAEAINNQGLVAGVMGTSGSNLALRAMVWNNETFSDAINPAHPIDSVAEAINSNGYIAGHYYYNGQPSVFYKNHPLGSTSYSWNYANYQDQEVADLNDQGLVAVNVDNGCGQSGCDRKGAIWNPITGAMVTIEPTDGWGMGAEVGGLNNLGQAVGQWMERSEGAILWDAANGIQPINAMLVPGTTYTIFGADDINDSGVILARGAVLNTSYTEARLLLLTPVPVPEPEIYALMLAGLGLVGFVARQGRKQN